MRVVVLALQQKKQNKQGEICLVGRVQSSKDGNGGCKRRQGRRSRGNQKNGLTRELMTLGGLDLVSNKEKSR